MTCWTLVSNKFPVCIRVHYPNLWWCRMPLMDDNAVFLPLTVQNGFRDPLLWMKWSPVSWRRDSGQSGGGHVAAGFVQNKARGSALGASFKGDLVVSYLGEEVLLAFGKKFELRQAG